MTAPSDIYVDTDFTGTSDGTISAPWKSLADAWTNEGANFDTAGTYTIHCRGTAADTSQPVISGWPAAGATSGTVKIIIRAQEGVDDGRYTGNNVVSTSHYRLAPGSGNNPLVLGSTNNPGATREIELIGLQIVAAGTSIHGINATGTIDVLTIDGCRVQHAGTSFSRGIRVLTGNGATIQNCLVHMTATAAGNNVSGINLNDSSVTYDVVNCTVAVDVDEANANAITAPAGATLNVRNCVGYGALNTSAHDFLNVDVGTTNANTSGTHDFDCATGDFVSTGTDYSPADSQTNAWGEGGTVGGTTPTHDINGNARNTTGNTAIGCFANFGGEGGGGAATILPFMMAHH